MLVENQPIALTEPGQIRVLLIEDDEDDYLLTRTLLSARENRTIKLDWVDSYDEGLARISQQQYDVYLVDYRLGAKTGTQLIQEANEKGYNAPMILLTGQDDFSIDQSALASGAADYLVKGRIDAQLLGRSIRYALSHVKTLTLVAQQQTKYRYLFEKSLDAIFVIDSQLRITEINSALENLFGYTQTELRRLNLARLFTNLDNLREIRHRVSEYDQLKDYETVLITKTGQKRNCLITIWVVEDANNQTANKWYQGIIRDISHQKRAQQDLILAEKLSMTGKIARSIAHEVRNPLTNLSLALEQLKEEIDVHDPYITTYTDIISRNITRIGQLVTEMLKSSKPRDPERKFQLLNEVVAETAQLVSDRLQLKRIELKTNYTSAACTVLIDRDEIKTALLNIMINAIEAMNEGEGILQLQTRLSDDGQVAIVEVIDNGLGMSAEVQQRLFDPFFTGKSGGMGLGLTAAQNIISSHQGRIDVITQPGAGTTFRLSFPIAK